jgi:hypothetical protein
VFIPQRLFPTTGQNPLLTECRHVLDCNAPSGKSFQVLVNALISEVDDRNVGIFGTAALPELAKTVGALVSKNSSMKNGVFWDVTPCGPCKDRRFGGT